MKDLVERGIFPEPPGDDVVQAFRKHVKTCGQPETFPQISTARPPRDGELVVLHHPVHIDRRRRPEKDMAPCPICSPTTGKYLAGGTLLWCEGTSAIYAIGPKCSLTLWEDGRLDTAVNLYMRTAKERQNADALVDGLEKIGLLRDWVLAHRQMVERVDLLHRAFAKEASKLRRSLANALRTGSAATAHIRGFGFLRGGWRLSAELAAVDATLARLQPVEGADIDAIVARLSASAVSDRLAELKSSRLTLARTAERIRTAADFMSRDNCEALGRWSRDDGAPLKFRVSHTASTIELRTGDEVWRGAVGLALPQEVPR